MGVYVADGILLGLVLSGTKIKGKLLDKQDEIIQYLENVVKISGDADAKAIFCLDNPYESKGNYYIGIFWQWSQRWGMDIDDKWQPLFLLKEKSDEMFSEVKHSKLQEKIFENLNNYIPNIKLEDIKFYEVRYFS